MIEIMEYMMSKPSPQFEKAKQEMPVNIQQDVKKWGKGLTTVPPSYIRWHRQLAEKDLNDRNWTIYHRSMVNDCRSDGLKFLQVIVEIEDELVKLKWSDQQSWYKKEKSGWSLFLY